MKKPIIVCLLAMTFAGCENHKAELEQANRERDSLYNILDQRDSTLNDFLQSYNEIEVNLDSIANRGNTISKSMDNQGELKATSRERINDDINTINALLKENREKVAELNKKLSSSGHKNKQLQAMIETLNTRIAEKDKELTDLNEKLAGANANIIQLQGSVDTLTATNTSQSQTISDQTAALHTAYYKIGKSKELQDMKIINKQGGLLGMGKSSKLSDNIDNSKFTKIDYTVTTTIPVNGEDIKIVTTHPIDSYGLEKEGKNKVTNLKISNPEQFWSASKYLVIIKD